jgi:hypothetical protein
MPGARPLQELGELQGTHPLSAVDSWVSTAQTNAAFDLFEEKPKLALVETLVWLGCEVITTVGATAFFGAFLIAQE